MQMNLFLRQRRTSSDSRDVRFWRPIYAESRIFQEVILHIAALQSMNFSVQHALLQNPHWKDNVLFFECVAAQAERRAKLSLAT